MGPATTVIEDGAGDKTLIGNSSDDTIDGGAGDDVITVGGLFNYLGQSSGGEYLIHGGDGQDTLSATGGEIYVYDIMPGGGNPRESATEKRLPSCRGSPRRIQGDGETVG